MVTVFAAICGLALFAVPQFLAPVQTMEIVPSFAVGSAVGLRGFMSYILWRIVRHQPVRRNGR